MLGRRLRGRLTGHRSLLAGSAWLVAARLLIAASGFLFWLVVAARHPASEVGAAAALFSLVLFLNFLTALGLPIAAARYCPDGSDESRSLFFWAVVITTLSSLVGVGLGVLVLPDSLLEGFDEIGLLWGGALLFVMVAGQSIWVLSDARMMALRLGGPVLVISAVAGFARIPLGFVDPLGDTAIWIWLVAAGSTTVGAVVKLLELRRRTGPISAARALPPSTSAAVRFAGVNTLAQFAIQAPFTMLPLLVVASVTDQQNAVFFLAWSIATLVFTIPRTVSQVLLVEGERGTTGLDDQTRLALMLGLVVSVGALLASVPGASLVRAVYGPAYGAVTELLPGLILTAIPWTIIATYLSASRIRHDTSRTAQITGAFAVGTLGPAVVLIPAFGLRGVVPSWLLGTVIGAVVSLRDGPNTALEVLAMRTNPVVARFASTVLLITGLGLVGYLFGGFAGLALTCAASVAIRVGAAGVLAPTALGLLVMSAVATVVEGRPLGPVGPDFVPDRPLAAAAGRHAAILAIAALVAAWLKERATRTKPRSEASADIGEAAPPPTADTGPTGRTHDVATLADDLRSLPSAPAVVTALILFSWSLSGALAPGPGLSVAVQRLLDMGRLSADQGPLAPVLVALVPGPAWLVGAASAVAVALLLWTLIGVRLPVFAAAIGIAMVGLTPWAGPDILLAVAMGLGAIAVGRTESRGRTVAVGGLIAGMVLAAPVALLAAPLVATAAWSGFTMPLKLIGVGTTIAALVPWLRWQITQPGLPVGDIGDVVVAVVLTAALTATIRRAPSTVAVPGDRIPHPLWRRWSLIVLALALVAAAATVLNSSTEYIADFRFDVFWDPADSLIQSAHLWDASRDLGRAGTEVHPVAASVVGLFRSYGASPWLAERLWHATLLVTAGTGAGYLLTRLRSGLGLEHALSAFAYAFNPYALILLVPSRIFIVYALAPWLVAGVINGMRSVQAVRWSGIVGLTAVLAVSADPASTIYLLPVLGVTAVYLIVIEGIRINTRVARWLGMTFVLVLLVGAAHWVRLRFGAAAIGSRIDATESVETVAATSSWSESWRGLGFWLNYFRQGGIAARDHHAVFVENTPIVLASFLPAVVSLALLWRARWRPRLLLVAIALVSLALMVGVFPPSEPTPYGELIRRLYDAGPLATGLRTTYKAGTGLFIGLSLGLGMGLAAGIRWSRQRMGSPLPGFAASLILLGALSVPMWSGSLYSPRAALPELPEYWRDAAAWLDDQPDADRTRVLALPGSSTTRYRWGNAGDDILEALVDRPVVRNTPFTRSTAMGDDLVRAIDELALSADYQPGSLAAVARRVGIGHVVIRNDVDWQSTGRPRPSALSAIRADATLDLVATFGETGAFTTDPDDNSAEAALERRLAPVEIYEVTDAAAPIRVSSATAPTVVSGSGAAWAELDRHDLLGDRPIRYSASVPEAVLQRDLEQGAPVVITDTNVNVERGATASDETVSSLLAPATGGEGSGLFPMANSQSVAWYPDATDIVDGSGRNRPSSDAPANAFDQDPTTAWRSGRLQPAIRAGLRVELREPQPVEELVLEPLSGPGSRAVTAVQIELSDGSVTTAAVDGRTEIALPASETESLEISVIGASAGTGRVGFAEIQVDDLDLRQFLEVPSDLTLRAAEGDGELSALLAEADFELVLTRRGRRGALFEDAMRRRFATASDRAFTIDGTAVYRPGATEDAIAQLFAPVTAQASSRLAPDQGHGFRAIDGDLGTGWLVRPIASESVTVTGPALPVGEVTVLFAVTGRTVPATVTVVIGDERLVATPEPSEGCVDPDLGPCVARATVTSSGATSTTIDVELTSFAAGVLPTAAPVELLEVASPFATIDPSASLAPVCRDVELLIDGTSVPLVVDASIDRLLSGEPVDIASCRPLLLEEGSHLLTAEGAVGPVSIAVSSPGRPAADPDDATAAAMDPTVEVMATSPTLNRIEVPADTTPRRLFGGASYAPGWKATADGRSLGPPEPLDAQVAWPLPPDGETSASIFYGPQRAYSAALGASAAGVAICLLLVLGRRGRRVESS